MDKKFNLSFRRVDVRVLLFTATVVVISCLCIFIYSYSSSYLDMIYTLRERVNSIYNYVEKEFDTNTFININTKEDVSLPSYKKMQDFLHGIKNATGVQYLYTAKRNADGKLVYVIDGLDESEDFRYPGDLIEHEITPSLSRALAGEKILPDDIVHTDWGDIFIAYMPVHDAKRDIVGVVGIEFPAGHQYKTYSNLRIVAPIIIILTCMISAVFAVIYFRRISNPHYQDLANTDMLTGIKNRNGYELDLQNMLALNNTSNLGFILADLNHLKLINDTYGHRKGDLYIKLLSQALKTACQKNEILYRVGGDEFIILVPNANTQMLDDFIVNANEIFTSNVKDVIQNGSCSFGKAICQGNTMADCELAHHLADEEMYQFKKEYYENHDTKISCI